MDTPVKSCVLGIQVMLHSEGGGGGTNFAIEKKCIGFISETGELDLKQSEMGSSLAV